MRHRKMATEFIFIRVAPSFTRNDVALTCANMKLAEISEPVPVCDDTSGVFSQHLEYRLGYKRHHLDT